MDGDRLSTAIEEMQKHFQIQHRKDRSIELSSPDNIVLHIFPDWVKCVEWHEGPKIRMPFFGTVTNPSMYADACLGSDVGVAECGLFLLKVTSCTSDESEVGRTIHCEIESKEHVCRLMHMLVKTYAKGVPIGSPYHEWDVDGNIPHPRYAGVHDPIYIGTKWGKIRASIINIYDA